MATTTHEGIIMIRGKGTGFFALPDEEEDAVIEREALGFALDGDLVEVELLGKNSEGRHMAKVTRVIKPKHDELIGLALKKADGWHLIPDNKRIHVRPLLTNATDIHEGMKIVVKVTSWKSPEEDPAGEITEVLGPAGDHETEMQAIIRGGGFSKNFPEPVQEAAQKLYETKDQIFKDAEQDPKRRDMRSATTMTIDPADAKDFDDAISFDTLPNGNFQIGIHIADVSHYVRENEVIDVEARERGTSIYLVDRVIPMLPEVLSNDLCSLRPNEDRLAFSAVFEMTADGHIEQEWYGQTIIHSDKRFSYEDAQEVLDKQAGVHLDELNTLMSIGRILRRKRYTNGAIAFEQPEVKFELDETGKPIRAYTKVRTETMLMIEDFMLLANRKVSEHIYALAKAKGRDAAFVYRIHDLPDPDKIEELAIFLRALGYDLETQKGIVSGKSLNKLLKEVTGVPEENLIKTATIRSMAKAVYSTKNIGHFGLAFKHYTHFTSPIRRYPDLMVHRLLRRNIDHSPISGKEIAKYEKLSIQSSEREMTAVRAERDSIKFKQVEYMADRVGQEFNATITGVTDWGIYVEDVESKAEGMIRLASLKTDFFEHQASKYRIKGQRTGKIYTLGDSIRVKLTRADIQNRELDFELLSS
ncbi:ribonuclease R [Candidatus Parcubacteria bacterium]|nr:ribonuclease R [Candidatus Parcubacteria bacterium]